MLLLWCCLYWLKPIDQLSYLTMHWCLFRPFTISVRICFCWFTYSPKYVHAYVGRCWPNSPRLTAQLLMQFNSGYAIASCDTHAHLYACVCVCMCALLCCWRHNVGPLFKSVLEIITFLCERTKLGICFRLWCIGASQALGIGRAGFVGRFYLQ